MKTILSKLSDEQASKELKQFTIWAATFSAVSLLMLWFLGFVGLALGARAVLLSFHKGNAGHKNLVWYRVGAGFAVITGLVGVFFGLNQ